MAWVSLVEEHPALHDGMHERAEAVLLLPAAGDQLLDHLAVSELNVGPGGVDEQFLGQAPGELVSVGEQEEPVFGDVRRRRSGRLAEDSFQHPLATEDGRGTGAIGGDLEDAGVSQDAAAVAGGWERDLAQLAAVDAGDAVVLGEPLVEEAPAGVDE